MTYIIKKHKGGYPYSVVDANTGIVIAKELILDKANELCWHNRDPNLRYQILSNSWQTDRELTWYCDNGDEIFPNGYPSFERARQAFIKDLLKGCTTNNDKYQPDEFKSYSVIDTFTGEEISFILNSEDYYIERENK